MQKYETLKKFDGFFLPFAEHILPFAEKCALPFAEKRIARSRRSYFFSPCKNPMYSSMTSLFIVYLIFRPSFSGKMIEVSVSCLRW